MREPHTLSEKCNQGEDSCTPNFGVYTYFAKIYNMLAGRFTKASNTSLEQLLGFAKIKDIFSFTDLYNFLFESILEPKNLTSEAIQYIFRLQK